jgi:methionine sulfoxide reductase heme-binding subunit
MRYGLPDPAPGSRAAPANRQSRRDTIVKLSGRAFAILFAVAGLAILLVTNQVLPPATPYQAQMRVWLAARATGIVALLLVTATVILGLALSHPDQARWKQAKRIYPWHETLWVFVLAFIGVHIVAIVLDPYAQVGILGALLPGLSKYRTLPVAVGSVALYAVIVTGATARYTRLLPAGFWLKLHRFSVIALGLGWIHGVLSGTDTGPLQPLYGTVAASVVIAAVYRYWIVRRRVARQSAALTAPHAAGRERAVPRAALAASRVPITEEQEVSHARPSAAT